jgi:hypothetical protein
MQETRRFFCPLKSTKNEIDLPQEDKFMFVLQLTESMLEQNSINGSDVASLIAKWTTEGLEGGSALQC